MDSFFGIGMFELVMIAVIALVILGPERLPAAMREMAKWMRQLREISNEFQSQFSDELKMLDEINPRRIINEALDPNATPKPTPKPASTTPPKPASTTTLKPANGAVAAVRAPVANTEPTNQILPPANGSPSLPAAPAGPATEPEDTSPSASSDTTDAPAEDVG